MRQAVRFILLAIALLAASGCKSSCDCFKHSYGQNAVKEAMQQKA